MLGSSIATHTVTPLSGAITAKMTMNADDADDADHASERATAIEAISMIIAAEKDTIITSIRRGIDEYIKTKDPADCLELVKLDANGKVTEWLPMRARRRYASALIAFVRKERFEGVALDSGLTPPISNLVAEIFASKLGKEADNISKQIIPLLVSSDRFLSSLSTALMAAFSSPIPKMIQGKVGALLTSKLTTVLAQTIDTSSSATIKASIAKVAAASVASPIAVKISASLLVSLGTALKPIIVKLLASTAFKAAIAAKVKAIVVGALFAAFAKIIGVKLGLTAGAAFVWLLIPVVVAWLAYEYSKFPEKLAESVSSSVAETMDNGFRDTSRSIAESIIEGVLVSGGAALATHLIADEAIQQLLEESVRAAQE